MPGNLFTNSIPFSLPNTKIPVAKASATSVVFAKTETLTKPCAG
jgi:hypothetical protein